MGEPAERRKAERGDLEEKVVSLPAFDRLREQGSSESSGFYRALEEAEKEYTQMEARLNESERQSQEKDVQISELKKMAFRDGLTGAYNHRYFIDSLEAEVKEAEAEGNPLSLLVIDIDHFKMFNSMYGHKAGDYVLRQLTHVAADVLRDTDIFARYGGEEFAVIMPMTAEKEAEEAAERLRNAVKDADLEYRGKKLNVTISVGVASHNTESADDLFTKADQVLYAAKHLGRDCVVSRSYAEELGVDSSQYSSEKS